MPARALLIAAAVLVVGACGAEESVSSMVEESPMPSAEPSDDARTGPMIVAIEQEGYASGPLEGVLALDEGCLYVDAGSVIGLAVFSHGSKWAPETSSVVHRLGSSVAVGEVLSGTAERHPVVDLVPWFLSVEELARAQSCADASGVTDAWVIGYFESGT